MTQTPEGEAPKRDPRIDPASFCDTLMANVDNEKLNDAEFRDFVRRSLTPTQTRKKSA